LRKEKKRKENEMEMKRFYEFLFEKRKGNRWK
jgi:hypothetical protein